MRSFRTKPDDRRNVFLRLSGQVEEQLRNAYDTRFREGAATQSSLATMLGVNRSAIHRRLTGRSNMTLETIADMVWALGHKIKVVIYDPSAAENTNTPYPARMPAGFDQEGLPQQAPKREAGFTVA